MPDDPHTKSKVRLETLRCRRTGQMFSADEHARCPYCAASAETIAASGDYTQFCDYQPNVDPVHFGFPDDTSRNKGG
ncbi:MAG: hypothetical protein IPI67_10015 [Myxococcales bacterium]|nr:hypothetical protein [Myxococcales bacterium]